MTKRDTSLDVIRVLAICMVIMCHVNNSMWPNAIRAYIYAIGWMGVPIFVLLTGYLMLPRQYTQEYIGKFIKRNLLPLFCALEIWNIIYYLISLMQTKMFSLKSAIHFLKIGLFLGSTDSSFWFMPMIVGLYLGLPIFAVLVQKGNAYVRIILGCIVYFGVVVCTIQQIFKSFNIRESIKPILEMNIFGSSVWGGSIWMLYLFIGYLFHKDVFSKLKLSALIIIFVVSLSANAFLIYRQISKENAQQFYGSLFVLLSACSFVLILRKLCEGLNEIDWFVNLFQKLSELSFSVYLIHIFLIPVYRSYANLLISNSPKLGYLIVLAITTITSFFIGYMLSFIPVFKRWGLLIK